MPKINGVLIVFLVGIVLGGLYLGSGTLLWAQGGTGAKPSDAEQKLTEQQTRGERWFIQRCSLCHLGRKLKTSSPPAVGPSLVGVFQGASPAKEKALQEFILKGTPNMPGFQYALDPKQFDDLIAYLKAL